ncbi:MAG TPA: 3-isopropylmalate dehydratase large subunit [Hellea balneolensis]|uniref:3-isopropylmalate dehydratase n=1 Tax=Hellea balneolensis TaxID=287478 RepID=A0A7C3G551_9PROT|nr:3-isopropylmalate dehydratase large subunit [Hellea balneolensis]
MARTLFDKLWDAHKVRALSKSEDLLYIDRIFLHERTGGIALVSLQEAGRTVRKPQHVFCSMDHIVDTFAGRTDDTLMPGGREFIRTTRQAAQREGITIFDIDDPCQGIVHVISPEQGIVLPGLSLVCPDSHTCTQGAFGALAWGIGSTQAEHAMVTTTLRVERPKTMCVTFDGELAPGVSAKDMILHLIGQYGASGGRGFGLEFRGATVRALGMEARMTLCNMAVEFGAFSSVIAPDDKTYAYLKNRPYAPKGDGWKQARKDWQNLTTDAGAQFDQEIRINASCIAPSTTWGTSPQHVVPLSGTIPKPQNAHEEKALAYMDLEAGQAVHGIPLDAAFIGSCTNARLSDLRLAADILKGQRIASHIKAICVPGSTHVKKAAEAEGLDKIFKAAGFEWREAGCSMCFYAGGESFGERERVISTTNRNFESRQGPQTRTHLASPATVAASAVAGYICSAAQLRAKHA